MIERPAVALYGMGGLSFRKSEWLTKNVGKITIDWDYFFAYQDDRDVFLFLKEEDAMAFKLRFCV